MAAKTTPDDTELLKICRETLEAIITQWNSGLDESAQRNKDRVVIDSAIGQMWAVILSQHHNLLDDVTDYVPIWREAYHYAVDAYFRLYFDRKRGRPAMQEQACRELLSMRERKLSYAKIGLVLKQSKDATRKQVKACEKRFAEDGNNSVE